MRALAFAALIFLAGWARVPAALAQEDGGGDNAGAPAGDNNMPPPSGAEGGGDGQGQGQGQGQEENGGGGEASEAPRRVSLEEARQSIGTIVDSFMSENGAAGYLSLRDKTTKKVRHLKLSGLEEKKVQPAGDARFAVPAKMTDLLTGQSLQAVFTVDFSGAKWQVVGMRLKQPAAAKPRAKADDGPKTIKKK